MIDDFNHARDNSEIERRNTVALDGRAKGFYEARVARGWVICQSRDGFPVTEPYDHAFQAWDECADKFGFNRTRKVA